MRSRPHWRGALALAWTPLNWLLVDARLTAIDAVPDSSIPTGDVRLAGWARMDVGARWTIDEHWSLTVACDNALGKDYEEIVGFTAPGRRGRLGVQFRF
jgi:outer membrane receptor protein involved in Fe transport